MKKFVVCVVFMLVAVSLILTACSKENGNSTEYMFDTITVADASTDDKEYLAHPDSVLLDNGDILTAYPMGHGKGETVIKISKDKGLTWNNIFSEQNPKPESFLYTEETPTIYKLNFTDGSQKLIMISGRPGWDNVGNNGEGFDVTLSVSTDDGSKSCNGLVWSEHENFFGPDADRAEYVRSRGTWDCIVAMASLTQLKDEEDNFINAWMGLFHDYSFTVYKTILTFDADGLMQWTEPVSVFDGDNLKLCRNYSLCEPEVVRSPDGNELAMLLRANKHNSNSYVTFSTDEGETWSAPQLLSIELTGDRHKAEYDPVSGKLVITYRSIRWKNMNNQSAGTGVISYGWLTWIGDYEDLKAGDAGKGDMLVKMAHTYQSENVELTADSDTGYAGVVVYPDGLFVMTSYGTFSPPSVSDDTYIIAKRFTVADLISVFGSNPDGVVNLFK